MDRYALTIDGTPVLTYSEDDVLGHALNGALILARVAFPDQLIGLVRGTEVLYQWIGGKPVKEA